MLLSRPVSRRSVFLTLFAALVAFATLTTAAQVAGTVAGAALYGVADQLEASTLAFLGLNTVLLLTALAAVCLAASAVFDRPSTPLAIGLLVVIGGYVLEVLGTLWPDAEFLQPYSPFHYLRPLDVLAGRNVNADLVVLAGLALVAVAFALRAVPAPRPRRADLNEAREDLPRRTNAAGRRGLLHHQRMPDVRPPLGIGLNLPTWPLRDGSYAGWPTMRRLAQAMEAMGVDTLWVPDHLQRTTPGRGTFGFWECWTILTAAAEATSRIGIGPFIACTGFRNPALLAKMAATLDEVSGGRLVLGLGSGVPARDPSWSAFGYDGSRHVSKYAEAVEVVTRLLRERAVTFEGEHYRTDAAELIPRGPRPDGDAGPGRGAGRADACGGGALRRHRQRQPVAHVRHRGDGGRGRCGTGLRGGGPRPVDARGDRLGPDRRGRARAWRSTGRAASPATPRRSRRRRAAIHAAGIAHLTFYIGAVDDPSPLPALTDETLAMFAPFLEAIRAA